MKRFVYLVQAKNGSLPTPYSAIIGEESGLIILTWGEEAPGCIYLPKSTWAQGRNRLLSEATGIGKPEYLYYILLDDDLVLAKGGWREFEAALSKYEPAIGTPFCLNHADMKRSRNLEVQHCVVFDAMCNAFHREVVGSDVLLPYNGKLDAQSWWFSQWFVIELAHLLYPKSTLQINTVWVENVAHGPYPRGGRLEDAREWFYSQVVKLPRKAHWWWIPQKLYLEAHRRLRWFKWLFWERYFKPLGKTGTYVIPSWKRHDHLHVADSFWANRLWSATAIAPNDTERSCLD